ncbi:MAG: hypothetical protein JWM19_2245 [Actinomycetia bacterium]|nr:hypothetical protein [Actinomycetes bacterium]
MFQAAGMRVVRSAVRNGAPGMGITTGALARDPAPGYYG